MIAAGHTSTRGTAARLIEERPGLSPELEKTSARVSSLESAHMDTLSKMKQPQKALEAKLTEAAELMKDRRDRKYIILTLNSHLTASSTKLSEVQQLVEATGSRTAALQLKSLSQNLAPNEPGLEGASTTISLPYPVPRWSEHYQVPLRKSFPVLIPRKSLQHPTWVPCIDPLPRRHFAANFKLARVYPLVPL